MAPINAREFETAYKDVDRLIGCNPGACSQRAKACRTLVAQVDVFGPRGSSTIYVKDAFIVLMQLKVGDHRERYANRTSVAHGARLGHNVWWRHLDKDNRIEGPGAMGFTPTCQCRLASDFYADYPSATVSEHERLCDGSDTTAAKTISELQGKVDDMEKTAASLRAQEQDGQDGLQEIKGQVEELKSQLDAAQAVPDAQAEVADVPAVSMPEDMAQALGEIKRLQAELAKLARYAESTAARAADLEEDLSLARQNALGLRAERDALREVSAVTNNSPPPLKKNNETNQVANAEDQRGIKRAHDDDGKKRNGNSELETPLHKIPRYVSPSQDGEGEEEVATAEAGPSHARGEVGDGARRGMY